MTRMFHKQTVSSSQPTTTKREAPDAWGNISYKVGKEKVALRNKFIRIESSKAEEEFLLDRYELAYNEFITGKDKKGNLNKAEDFVFTVQSTLTIVPANGLTRKEIVGELVMDS